MTAPKVLLGALAVAALTASGCGGSSHAASGSRTSSTASISAHSSGTTTTRPGGPGSSAASGAPTGTGPVPGPVTTTVMAANGDGRTVSATSGGLDVKLTITPSRGRVAAPVSFAVTADASHAVGALGYQLSYGDGETAQNPVPAFCIRGGTASEGAWTFTHRYSSAGTYTVSIHVHVNCGGDDVTTSAAVTVATS